MSLSPETRFGFAYGLAFALASGIRFGFGHLCSYVRESIANAGMRDSLGIVQLSGKLGEKRKHCKVGWKWLET